MVKPVDRTSFREEVLQTTGMVLLNFWAEWSAECQDMAAKIRKVTEVLEDQCEAFYVDWEKEKELAQELGVYGVPTLLIYRSGSELARYSGTMKKGDLVKRIIQSKRKEG